MVMNAIQTYVAMEVFVLTWFPVIAVLADLVMVAHNASTTEEGFASMLALVVVYTLQDKDGWLAGDSDPYVEVTA